MPEMFQQNLPVMPVERVENRSEGDLQKVEKSMSFQEARLVTGEAGHEAIRRSGHGLKDFGDPAQVGRQCKGLENLNVARLWQEPDTRVELVVALAERAGIQVQTVLIVPHHRRNK